MSARSERSEPRTSIGAASWQDPLKSAMLNSYMKQVFLDKLPFVLAILLYLLIYFLRLQQGGWEIQTELFSGLRDDLDHRISIILPSPQAELLSGILLGNKKDLPPQLKLALRDTSTLHIVVVSGQNLTMIAGLFLPLAWLISRKFAIFLSFTAIIFYTILTGAQVPVLRAALMASASFLAVLLGRQKDGVWVLLISVGFMLLVNPKWISDLSFQLSFLATAGVVLLAPIILKKLETWPKFIAADLAVTTSAQLMVTPIIAQSFHQFSIVSVFANLLVGWTVPIIMILGSVMLVFSFLNNELVLLIGILVNALLSYFVYIVQFFASLPFAWEYVGEKSFVFWVGYYFILTGVMLVLNNGKNSTRE